MNSQLKKKYSDIGNIYTFQDFVNLNMENFCFYEEIGEKNCKPYILLLMMNDLLGETADDKKLVRNFNCFGDEQFGLLEKLNRIFFNVMHYLPDK